MGYREVSVYEVLARRVSNYYYTNKHSSGVSRCDTTTKILGEGFKNKRQKSGKTQHCPFIPSREALPPLRPRGPRGSPDGSSGLLRGRGRAEQRRRDPRKPRAAGDHAEGCQGRPPKPLLPARPPRLTPDPAPGGSPLSSPREPAPLPSPGGQDADGSSEVIINSRAHRHGGREGER